MDYSYRNHRYKRRKSRQLRRIVAILAVSLTAGILMAGYGLIHLFIEKKEVKREETSTIILEADEDEEDQENTPKLISQIEEEASADIAEEADVEGKEKNKGEGKKDKKTFKKKDQFKVSAKEAELYYQDTAFIGDSRTQGLQLNAGIRSPKFFAGRGLNVKNALTDKVVRGENGDSLTVIEALEGKEYKKIYISFGINELGWTYPDIFIERYKTLVDEVKKKQEKAEIVVYGILPVTKSKSDKDKIFNMKNVKKFNKLIKQMAKDINITYVDLSAAVKDETGFLPEGVTPDGIHMNKEYCKRILAYIVNKKI